LENWNVLDFLVETYEEDMGRRASVPSRWGRHRNERFPYQEGHWKTSKKTRVKRADGHRNLPNIIGQWFPRRDDENSYGYYCACMLLLLKPWRDVKTDLKLNNQSWDEAFHQFVANHTKREKIEFVLSGIQFFHECNSTARDDRNSHDTDDVDDHDLDCERDDESNEELQNTQDSIDQIRDAQLGWPERQYAQGAVDVARLCGIFRNENNDWNVDQQSFCKGTSSNLDSLKRWKEEMQKKVEQKSNSITSRSRVNMKATVEPVNEGMMGTDDFPWQAVLGEESSLSAIDPSQLNDEQVSFGLGICENVTDFIFDSVARLTS